MEYFRTSERLSWTRQVGNDSMSIVSRKTDTSSISFTLWHRYISLSLILELGTFRARDFFINKTEKALEYRTFLKESAFQVPIDKKRHYRVPTAYKRKPYGLIHTYIYRIPIVLSPLSGPILTFITEWNSITRYCEQNFIKNFLDKNESKAKKKAAEMRK